MSNANELEHDTHSRSNDDISGGSTSTTMNDDNYIEYAYQASLGRRSDAGGKEYWLHELQTGHVDRPSLLKSFSASSEGQEHAGAASSSTSVGTLTVGTSITLNDDDYIEYAYQASLGRRSDAGGKEYWLHELQAGHVDRPSLLKSFLASSEGQEHLSLVGVSIVNHDSALFV